MPSLYAFRLSLSSGCRTQGVRQIKGALPLNTLAASRNLWKLPGQA
ncbi:MAG: hypothetical protein ACOYNB_07130 [Aquabacterium sp.]